MINSTANSINFKKLITAIIEVKYINIENKLLIYI